MKLPVSYKLQFELYHHKDAVSNLHWYKIKDIFVYFYLNYIENKT